MNGRPPHRPPPLPPPAAEDVPRVTQLDPADWVIVLAHGGQWIGKPRSHDLDGSLWLDPGLALDVMMTPGQMPGAVTIAYRCRPVLYIASWHRIRVPAGAHVQPCRELDAHDWRQLASAIDVFGENMAKTLAARSGLVLPQ